MQHLYQKCISDVISDLQEIRFSIRSDDNVKGIHLLQAPFQIIKYIVHRSALTGNRLSIAMG